MMHCILVRKWLDPMTGEVWADKPVPRPAPSGKPLLHEFQYAENTKRVPHSLAAKLLAGGAWQKVGEYDDGTGPPVGKTNWKAEGAMIQAQPPVGPALKKRLAPVAAKAPESSDGKA